MESDDPGRWIANADGELTLYVRGDSIRIVNNDDGSSLDFPKSLSYVLRIVLAAMDAEPVPRHEPQRRVVHQPRRFVRSLSEGMPKG